MSLCSLARPRGPSLPPAKCRFSEFPRHCCWLYSCPAGAPGAAYWVPRLSNCLGLQNVEHKWPLVWAAGRRLNPTPRQHTFH
eukprot:scaffold513990_cov37-Prasinocladus_malaysianus.AAC.1